MATFDQLVTIAKDAGFQGRVRYALMVAALNVYNEALNTPGHAARAAYSTRVLGGNFDLYSATFAVLTNSTVAAEANPATSPDFAIPDADIQFQVNSMWNALAGA